MAPWDGQWVLDVDMPTFVFVHGANCNSFFWTPLIRELAFRGYRSVALDLPGHGLDAALPSSYQAPQDLEAFAAEYSHLAEIRLRDNVKHVVGALGRVAHYGPVILVGHSLGGLTITGVGNMAHEQLEYGRLVYLAASCCVELPSLSCYWETCEAQSSLLNNIPTVGDPTSTRATRINWRSADPEFLQKVKDALMAEGTDEQLRTAINLLEPDESITVVEDTDAQVDARTWGKIPRTYIRATCDRAMPLELQDRMIREADDLTPDNKFHVHNVDATHLGIQLLHVSEIANILTGSCSAG
jgi:pimeloyl-ACP methyl ester carboxylesterase